MTVFRIGANHMDRMNGTNELSGPNDKNDGDPKDRHIRGQGAIDSSNPSTESGEAIALHSMRPRLLVINYLQCQQGFATSDRILRTPYFLFVHKGKGDFTIGDRRYHCTEGDLFYCPAGVPNAITADPQDPYLLTGIEFEFFAGMPGYSFTEEYGDRINVQGDSSFMWILFELIHRCRFADVEIAPYADSLLKAWLLLVAGITRSNPVSVLSEKITLYLASHDDREVSLSEVGAAFKFHPNHLNRIFRKKYGSSIYKYHLDLRIRKAKQLLLYSHFSIKEVAFRCGFSEINYFSRVFRKKTGCSPTGFRGNL